MRLSLSPDARSPRRRAGLGGDGAAGALGAGGTAGFGAAASAAAAHAKGRSEGKKQNASKSGRNNGQRLFITRPRLPLKKNHKINGFGPNEHCIH